MVEQVLRNTKDAGSIPAPPTRCMIDPSGRRTALENGQNRGRLTLLAPGAIPHRPCEPVRPGSNPGGYVGRVGRPRKICTVIDRTLPCRLGQKLTLQLVR